ncbi:MAG: DUF4845 domain-containing protein [Candidatus Koribacter versatilis]|uniref:DUF4845 domain-containing protein n=1 Tax=Candidatus Korobacter versatilis TaxID=658062 RepID=A0A932A9N0_9BACT|nr:DUF4845 domain-containing protein [Candidatus Koribacter versatilis]
MKQLKSLIGILVVVAAFYVVWKLMPPYYNQLQFQDAVDAETRASSYSPNKTEQDIRDSIMKKARENDIPVTPEQIKVMRFGTDVSVTVDYTVHVDLLVRPIDLNFHVGSKNKAI